MPSTIEQGRRRSARRAARRLELKAMTPEQRVEEARERERERERRRAKLAALKGLTPWKAPSKPTRRLAPSQIPIGGYSGSYAGAPKPGKDR